MAGHGEQHVSHKKEYIIVFFVLAILTVVEVMIPDLKVAYFYKASSLVLLAASKAFVVAYFYMHLKEETGWLRFIAALPIVAVLYAVVLMLESYYR